MRIVLPTAPEPDLSPVRPERSGPAGGPAELRGVPVGFLWNGKQNGDLLLAELAEWLSTECGIESLGLERKLVASSGTPPELLADLAARARLVVTGPGD